ncbi:GDSL esterase/lipase EXL3-like [Wolffia australiana]
MCVHQSYRTQQHKTPTQTSTSFTKEEKKARRRSRERKMEILSMSQWFVFFFLLFPAVLHAASPNATVPVTPRVPAVPAVIVFGDSVVDPGNNNILGTLTRCNFPPYGKDFPNHQATGRFSNGKIPNDLIVAGLGIKDTLPAYLDPSLRPEELLTGVSFASGGSGFDPVTSTMTNTLSNDAQLSLFREYKGRVRTMVGEKKAGSIVEDSLYIICTGSNDLVNTYFNGPLRRAQFNLPSYIKFMSQSASSFINDLHKEGGRKIAVLGLPPIGCVPADRTLFGGPNRDCAEQLNTAARLFNDALQSETIRLNTILPGSRIIYVDIYSPLLELIVNPTHYGFEVATRGCCGTGNVEAAVICNALLVTTCEDPSKYVFWDGYHPTEAAYRILIDEVARKYIPAFIG